MALALVPDVGAVEVLELEPGDVVEPTVVFPDGPVAVVPLTSRTTLLATSQHCLRS
ncbi:putative glutamine synthetase (fragment) [Bradyrhizobium sp. STM 3843]